MLTGHTDNIHNFKKLMLQNTCELQVTNYVKALQTSCHAKAMSSGLQAFFKKITVTILLVCYSISPHQILIQPNLKHKVTYATCGTINKQKIQLSQQ
jgi:hypothetical protein